MKIYGSTQYVSVDTEPTEWLQLNVNSVWDFTKKDVCFQSIKGSVIGYSLIRYTRVNDKQSRICYILDLTDEMKGELINMGYTIAKQ